MYYNTKVDILYKISKIIRLYAKQHHVERYLVKKILNDKYNLNYEVLFLNEVKVFEHSKQFKLKKRNIIDRRGNKKKEYYSELDLYLKENHTIYFNCKSIALKLINKNDEFTPMDLQQLNLMFKTLKVDI